MSHATHFDDCGCLTARYEARIATLEAERQRYHDERDEALSLNDYCAQTLRDLTTALREQRANANALRDALEKADAAFNAWGRDEDGIHPEAWPAVEHLREALLATPAASLAALKAEVLERACMTLLHKLANLMDAQREEEPHTLMYDTIQLGIIDTEFDIAEIRALAAQEVTK